MRTLLELKNISYESNNNKILKNINLQIKEGEKIALIGRSGSGKSTLISILNGSLKTINGELKIFDKEFDKLENNQKIKIGTIWQDLRLIDDISAEQNVNCGLLGKKNILFAFKNLLNISSYNKAHKCMQLCKLRPNIYSINLNKLSGGQKQRIAISRSIIQEPSILFADEPFNNLDPKISLFLKDLFISGEIKGEIKFPKTILFASHRIDLLDGYTRIIGLREGEIFFNVKKNQLRDFHFKEIY